MYVIINMQTREAVSDPYESKFEARRQAYLLKHAFEHRDYGVRRVTLPTDTKPDGDDLNGILRDSGIDMDEGNND